MPKKNSQNLKFGSRLEYYQKMNERLKEQCEKQNNENKLLRAELDRMKGLIQAHEGSSRLPAIPRGYDEETFIK